MNPEHGYWIDGNGTEWHVSELSDSHLKNVYNLLRNRKEKNMQFMSIRNEMIKRDLY
jgi:hypothetical protein